MDFTNLMLGGVPVMLVIVGLVQAAKKLGVSGNASFVLALVLGVVVGVVSRLEIMYPSMSPWVSLVVTGLAVGVGSTGLYDIANLLKPPVIETVTFGGVKASEKDNVTITVQTTPATWDDNKVEKAEAKER